MARLAVKLCLVVAVTSLFVQPTASNKNTVEDSVKGGEKTAGDLRPQLVEYEHQLTQLRDQNDELTRKVRRLEDEAKRAARQLRDCEETSTEGQRETKHWRKEASDLGVELLKMHRQIKDAEKGQRRCEDERKLEEHGTVKEQLKQCRDQLSSTSTNEELRRCRDDLSASIKELEQRKESGSTKSGDATSTKSTKVIDAEKFMTELLAMQKKYNWPDDYWELQRLYGQCLLHMERNTFYEVDKEQTGRFSDVDACVAELRLCEKFSGQTRIAMDKCIDDWYAIKEKYDKLHASTTDNHVSPASSDVTSTSLEDRLAATQEQATNCGETLKIVREKLDKETTALRLLTVDHERLVKNCSTCPGRLTDCESEKGHLEYLKRGYDMVIEKLEGDAKSAGSEKEKCEKHAQAAFDGAAKYRLYLVTAGILFVIVGSTKVYNIARDKLESRRLAQIAEKQQEKLLANKKKTTKNIKQK